MKSEVITHRDFLAGTDPYLITVKWYDKALNHVTAEWSGNSPDQNGELGFGIESSDRAIELAEKAILASRKGGF